MDVSIRIKIKSLYASLSDKEKIIADYILANPHKIAHNSISDLSNDLHVASSTIFQFTKKLGYNGFKDFKMAVLVQENDFIANTIHEDIESDDNEFSIAQKVFDSNIKTIADTKSILQQDTLQKACQLILQCKTLYFFGVGGSEILAADAFHKFLRSPIKVLHNSDYHIQLMEAAVMTADDVAICISHTGKTKETIRIAKNAKKNGAKVIVITSHANSPLAQLGDVVFISVSAEIEFHSEALSSRISQLSILDALYVIIMFMSKDKINESLIKIRRTIANTKK